MKKVYVVIPACKKAKFDYLINVYDSEENAIQGVAKRFQKVVVDKKTRQRSVWTQGDLVDHNRFYEETYWDIKVTDANFGLHKQKFKIIEREII